jgi:hypothetical protein
MSRGAHFFSWLAITAAGTVAGLVVGYLGDRLWRKRESLLDIVLRREARAMAEFERRNEMLK